jgi:hypothetical protein
MAMSSKKVINSFEVPIETNKREYLVSGHAMILRDSLDERITNHIETKRDHSDILLSNQVKVYIPIAPAYYHFMVETMTAFTRMALENPGCVFLIHGAEGVGNEWRSSMLLDLLNKLSKLYGTSQIYLDKGAYFVKNVAIVSGAKAQEAYLQEVYRSINGNRTNFPKPHRLIYISRTTVTEEFKAGTAEGGLRLRLGSEDILEDYFRSRGYEIIYPEQLSVKEKIIIFRETKVLASVTGAGLSNMTFMQPGSAVINISSYVAQRNGRKSIHSGIYWDMAFHKDLLFMSIPSDGESSEAAILEIRRYESIINQLELL